MKKYNYSKTITVFFVVMLNLLIFQDFFILLNDKFNYIDEFVTLLSLIIIFVNIIQKKRIYISDCFLFILSLLVLTLGIYSNYFDQVQTSLKPIFVDALTMFKNRLKKNASVVLYKK